MNAGSNAGNTQVDDPLKNHIRSLVSTGSPAADIAVNNPQVAGVLR